MNCGRWKVGRFQEWYLPVSRTHSSLILDHPPAPSGQTQHSTTRVVINIVTTTIVIISSRITPTSYLSQMPQSNGILLHMTILLVIWIKIARHCNQLYTTWQSCFSYGAIWKYVHSQMSSWKENQLLASSLKCFICKIPRKISSAKYQEMYHLQNSKKKTPLKLSHCLGLKYSYLSDWWWVEGSEWELLLGEWIHF